MQPYSTAASLVRLFSSNSRLELGKEKIAAGEAVGQPARGGRSQDIEDAHQGEQVGGPHFGNAVVVAGGNEMRSDQPVGAGSAHKEAAGQHPEGRRTEGQAKRF